MVKFSTSIGKTHKFIESYRKLSATARARVTVPALNEATATPIMQNGSLLSQAGPVSDNIRFYEVVQFKVE